MADDSVITTPTPPLDETGFLGLAFKRFNQADTAEREIREKSLLDLKFRAGEQWPENIQNSRTVDQRPCITINRIPQFVRQVTNDARHNRPSIHVSPVNDGGDQATADIINGMFRHIEVQSAADIAYDTAVDAQVTMGWGYFRVNTCYVDDDSFEQEICIERIKNAFTVYFDPGCVQPDYSDANWAFIIEDMTKENYKAMYPNTAMASALDLSSVGDHPAGWRDGESVRVAEYFVKSHDDKWLYQKKDGTVVEKEPKNFVNKRRVRVPKITWYKINAAEIIEQQDWVGKYIPIIPVLGDDLDIDGRRDLSGLVRAAQDPQRLMNYWITAQTEAIALAPKAPWLIAAGQMKGFEQIWQTANIKTTSHLPYNPISIDGIQVPPPQRMTGEPPVQAMTVASQQAGQYLKDVTGIYDASLGAGTPDVSGKAIIARQGQTNIANFHYVDNLSRSIKYLGKIILDLIPKIYDTERVVRIIGPDGSPDTVTINQNQVDPLTQEVTHVLNDVTVGRYDVTVDTGPSYSTKRQQSSDSMQQISQAYPELWSIAGDLMVEQFDWPGAEALAERLKMALPPPIQMQVQSKEQTGQAIPPQLMAKMNQQQQAIQQLSQALQAAHQKLQTKQLENASKEKIAAMNNETNLAVAQIQMGHEAGMATLEAQLNHTADLTNNFLDMQSATHEADIQKQQQAQKMMQTMQVNQHQSSLQPPPGAQPPAGA